MAKPGKNTQALLATIITVPIWLVIVISFLMFFRWLPPPDFGCTWSEASREIVAYVMALGLMGLGGCIWFLTRRCLARREPDDNDEEDPDR